MQYWGFDLGDGESTLARVSSEGKSYPEIVEVEGNKVIITVWAIMRDGEVRIGDNAARSAAAAVRSAARFKRRFLNAQSDSAALIRDFSARVFESLRGSGELVGGEKSNSVYVGCPAGWNAEARERYQRIFETIGFPTPHVVPFSPTPSAITSTCVPKRFWSSTSAPPPPILPTSTRARKPKSAPAAKLPWAAA